MTRHTVLSCVLTTALTTAACGANPNVVKRQHADSAAAYVQRQQYATAAIEYQRALQADPNFGEARVGLAETYIKLNDGARALAEYSRAADLMPADADVQLKAGRLLALAGRFEDARTRAEGVLTRNPRNVDAQLLLGNSLLGLKDLDGAVAEVEEAIQLDPTAARSQSSMGVLQMAKGRKDLAQAAFEKAVALEPRAASPRLALAGFYWSIEDAAAAERELKTVVEIDPGNAVAAKTLAALYMGTNRSAEAEPYLKGLAAGDALAPTLALADYYTVTKRYDDAIAVLRPLTKGKDGAVAARTKLAVIAYAQRRQADAHRELDEVLKLNPTDAGALLVRSRFLLAEGRLDSALADAKASVRANSRSAAGHYLLGTIQTARQELDQAIASFNEVLKINPRATAAQVQLARLTLVKGSAEESLQQAREAVKNDSGNPVTHMVLADSLIGNRQLTEAAAEIKKLLAQFPDSSPVHVRAGRLALLGNDAAAARRSFDRALALEPRSLDALSGLVAVDLAQRRPAAAAARVDNYLEKMPNEPGLLMLAARAYTAAGDTARAQGFLERVTRLEPANTAASSMLGRVYLAQNKLDQARQTFEDVTRRQPQDVNSQLVVAMILEAQGQTAAARKSYESILERDPNSAAAANNLAWLYAQSGGDLQKAGDLAQRARRLMPQDARVSDTVGWVYYKQGLPSLALPEFERSIASEPNNALYHFHLGLAYRQAGEETKGREALQRALKLQPDFVGAGEARAALNQ